MAKSDEEYISVSEAAEILGISRQRVLQLIEAGRLEARKVGNSYIIARSALQTVEDRKPGRPAKAKEATKKAKAKQKQ
jgi:excisionase family DNA binding protein